MDQQLSKEEQERINRLNALRIRMAFAREMVRYYSQSELLVGPEVDALDIVLPVGFALPEGFPERALYPLTPLEFWMWEGSFARMVYNLLTVPPELLPEHTLTEAPPPLPASSLPIAEAV